jgi:hypothetical protein
LQAHRKVDRQLSDAAMPAERHAVPQLQQFAQISPLPYFADFFKKMPLVDAKEFLRLRMKICQDRLASKAIGKSIANSGYVNP